jgi:hypothetical protein
MEKEDVGIVTFGPLEAALVLVSYLRSQGLVSMVSMKGYYGITPEVTVRLERNPDGSLPGWFLDLQRELGNWEQLQSLIARQRSILRGI